LCSGGGGGGGGGTSICFLADKIQLQVLNKVATTATTGATAYVATATQRLANSMYKIGDARPGSDLVSFN
jgi:hypothetical protein